MLILGIIGLAAGALFGAQFAALGAWGTVVGFIVTLAYFGFTESRTGGGQSLGKRALNLRVVSRTGEALSAPAAFVRAAVLCVAYFLNGAGFDFGRANQWGAVGISVLIFGLIFSMVYMLIFNRRTRQSIHDLAVGAFVVKGGPGKGGLPTGPIWRGHAAVVGVAILVMSVGGLLISKHFLQTEPLANLALIQQKIDALPGVDRVGVNLNSLSSNNGTTTRLFINAVVDASAPNQEVLARRIAQVALTNYPAARRQHAIAVTLSSGYDIGIASWWRSTNYVYTPEDWQAPLGTYGKVL
ncbi:hypothetical protein ASD15_29955 [Massilia sp. Root351]|nr:hypothetical protein ASD15_29955 [Massilia sp. Root351]